MYIGWVCYSIFWLSSSLCGSHQHRFGVCTIEKTSLDRNLDSILQPDGGNQNLRIQNHHGGEKKGLRK
jgi:hypothetical protein